MTSITDSTSSGAIAASSLKHLNAKLTAREMTPDEVASLDQMLVQKNTRPVGPADNDPSKLYAEIKVNGKTVAKVYNGGSAEGPNSLMRLKMDDGAGPQLAQKRAEQIAQFLGGEVVKAKTAQTQAQWAAQPPRQFAVNEQQLALDREQFFGARWQRLGLTANTDPGILLAAQES